MLPELTLFHGRNSVHCTNTHSLAADEGDLRLVGRVDVNGFVTGALQVFLNGAYGAVCSKGFDAVDADVACRQMGFIGGKPIDTAVDRTGPDLVEQVQVMYHSCTRA